MPKKKTEKQEEPKSFKGASQTQLEKYLKDHKEHHYNFEEQVNYTVSTGSLLFDVELGGGLKPGCIVCGGASFAGKSSFTAQCVKNFLETVENSKALWIKAEGRLDEEFMERSGVKFVFNSDEWVDGTCFVFETNIFEIAADLINQLVQTNPENVRYAMVIDSMDGLIRKNDFTKSAAESEQVGGQQLLTSTLFKKANLAMNKKGHLLFMIKQVRAKISVDKYAPQDKNASVGAGGGNALTHSANQILQFEPRTKSRYITDDGTKNGKTVGHYCKITISKGVKETPDVVVQYPVKHGRKEGKSVWQEIEIIKVLEQWGLLIRAGSWFAFAEEYTKQLQENGIEIDGALKIQGETALREWFEENSKVRDFTYKHFVNILEPQGLTEILEDED